MSKYDFELNLDSENSLSLIVDMIKPNSKILEFGPAHGRLTKYLKEAMNCIVDIVEIDENAGKEASKYANKSFIGNNFGNIENYKWLELLKNERYDYIVFADVLEHLYWPEKVLESCKKILKDTGSILISIPNIAHNSVIIDLINDEFKYNEIGLLDDTHIRFFTYHSFLRMISKIGFVTSKESAIYSRVGENEIKNSYDNIEKSIARQLRLRENGNVYQFIFELKKDEYYLNQSSISISNLDKACEYEFVCYIKDKKIDFYTEINTIRKNIYSNIVNQKINLLEYKEIEEVRIDPITSNCIIDGLEIYTIQNNKKIELPIKNINCDIKYDNKYFFSTNDPQIYISLENKDICELFLSYKLLYYDDEVINEFIELLLKIKEKEEEISVLKLDKEEEISVLKLEKEEKQKYINEIESSRGWKLLKKIKKLIGK